MHDHHEPQGSTPRQSAIDQARLSLDQCRRMLDDAGLTPANCLERLRSAEGDAAVDQVLRDVEESLRGFREQVERDAIHAAPARIRPRFTSRGSFV